MGDYPRPDENQRIAALKRLYDAFGLRIFSLQTGAWEIPDPYDASIKGKRAIDRALSGG